MPSLRTISGFVCCASLAVGALPGCDPGKEAVDIEGRALHADSTAVSSAQVQVEREQLQDGGDPSNYYLDQVGWAAVRDEPTLADGRFSIALHSQDGYDLGVWRAVVPASDGEAGPTFFFRPYESTRFADLPAWTPKLTSSADASGNLVLNVNAPPAPAPVKLLHAERAAPDASQGAVVYRLELVSRGEVIWTVWASSPSFTVAREAFEDRTDVSLRVTTLANAFSEDKKAFLGIGQQYQSPYDVRFDAAFASPSQGTSPPISRGAPCTGIKPAQSTCPLTDGIVDTAPLSTHRLQLSAESPSVVFTLPRPATLRELVLRRAMLVSVPATVEGSADAVHWSKLGAVAQSTGAPSPLFDVLNQMTFANEALMSSEDVASEGDYLAIPLDTAQGPVSQVRLRLTNPTSGSFDSIAEASFFE